MGKFFVKIQGHWLNVFTFSHPGRSLKKYHLKDATNIFNQIKDHSDGGTGRIRKKRVCKINNR